MLAPATGMANGSGLDASLIESRTDSEKEGEKKRCEAAGKKMNYTIRKLEYFPVFVARAAASLSIHLVLYILKSFK